MRLLLRLLDRDLGRVVVWRLAVRLRDRDLVDRRCGRRRLVLRLRDRVRLRELIPLFPPL